MTTTAQSPTTEWQPFREPLRATLTRTIGIALVAGAIFAQRWGGMSRWPIAAVVMLWPALGGHFLELWFLGGVVFVFAMWLTAGILTGQLSAARPIWWIGGLAFIGIELVAQVVLHLRGQPSFYDGRG